MGLSARHTPAGELQLHRQPLASFSSQVNVFNTCTFYIQGDLCLALVEAGGWIDLAGTRLLVSCAITASTTC